MGFRLALAHAGLRGATARAVRASRKFREGDRSPTRADAPGRVPAACVSAREGLAARAAASVVPAASKTTLDAVTYAFAEDGSAAVLDAPVGKPRPGDGDVVRSFVGHRGARATSAGASPAPPASPASPAPDVERLTFEPSRVEDLKEARRPPRPRQRRPRRARRTRAPWPPSPATTCCMLYGVDQDKEDSKYKVAFFDLDAVVAAGALRDAAAAVRAHVASGESPGAREPASLPSDAFSAKTTAFAARPGAVAPRVAVAPARCARHFSRADRIQ